MIRRRIRGFSTGWRLASLSSSQLGKYIVLYASLIHIGWALILLETQGDAPKPTPLFILLLFFGGWWRTAIMLCFVATLALTFPFLRRRLSNAMLAVMLIPQQTVLLLSAGAGIWAASVGHYADGVMRPWEFILADQLPIILTAFLYTVAVVEAAFNPPKRPADA